MPQTSLSPAHTPKREDFRRVVEIYLKGNKAYSLESVNATELSCAKAVRLIATGWASAVCAYVTELLRSLGVRGLICFRMGCGLIGMAALPSTRRPIANPKANPFRLSFRSRVDPLAFPTGSSDRLSSHRMVFGMKEKLQQKLIRWVRVIVGGPLGLLAWSISGASALAIVVWGLKTVALPLLMLKTASWGIWGFGVLRESKTRSRDK